MRLFKIQPNTTDVYFSADGLQVAAPSDVPGEVVLQKLVLNVKGRLPPELRVLVGEGTRLLGVHSEKALRLLLPAEGTEPARVVAKSFAGRAMEVLLSLGHPALQRSALVDQEGRFAASAEAGTELVIVDLRSGKTSTYACRARGRLATAHRFTEYGLVVSEATPQETVGRIQLIDPEQARPTYVVEKALSLVSIPATNAALVLVVETEGKALRAEVRRLGTSGPPPVLLASWPMASAEAKWLAQVAVRPSWRPVTPGGTELALPEGDGGVRIQTWRQSERALVHFFRPAAYSHDGKRVAGPGAGISVEATFLCVEELKGPPVTQRGADGRLKY